MKSRTMMKMRCGLRRVWMLLKRKIAKRLCGCLALHVESPQPNITKHLMMKMSCPEIDHPTNNSSQELIPKKLMKISYSEISRATNDFSPELIIDEFRFGKVYEGTLEDGEKVAVKRYKLGYEEEFRAELMVLSQIRHTNVASLIGFCYEMSEMILVQEYMEKGTLGHYLHHLSPSKLSWEKRLRICIDSAEALHYLHTGCSSRFIHGDVNPFSIFLDENYTAKIANFGLSAPAPFDVDAYSPRMAHIKLGEYIGRSKKTPTFGYYVDPQYSSTSRLTEKSDVYSFGVTLLEVLGGRLAFTRIREVERNRSLAQWRIDGLKEGRIKEIIDPDLVANINPSSLRTFVQTAYNCLENSGDVRPTMREVLWSLKLALEFQQTGAPGEWREEDIVIDAGARTPTEWYDQEEDIAIDAGARTPTEWYDQEEDIAIDAEPELEFWPVREEVSSPGTDVPAMYDEVFSPICCRK